MISQLSQEQITEYASDAQTTQQPTGSDYSQGVRVGKTIPAKWWNWLFNAATKRIFQARNDSQNMLTELKNAVVDAGITPDATISNQLALAVRLKAQSEIDTYVQNIKATGGVWLNIPSTARFPNFYGLTVLNKIDDEYYCLYWHLSNYWYGVTTKDLLSYEIQTSEHRFRGESVNEPTFYVTNAGAVRFMNTIYTCMATQNRNDDSCTIKVIRANPSNPAQPEVATYTKALASGSKSSYALMFVIGNAIYCLTFDRRNYRYYLAMKDTYADSWTETTGTTAVSTEHMPDLTSFANAAVTPIFLSGSKYLVGGYIVDISTRTVTSVYTDAVSSTTGIAYSYKLDDTHYMVQPIVYNNTAPCAVVSTDGTVEVKDYYISVRLHKQLGGNIIIKQSSPDYDEATSGIQAFSLDGGATFSNFPTSWSVISSGTTVTVSGEVRNCFKLNGKYYTSVYTNQDYRYVLYVSDTLSANSSDYTQVTTKVLGGSVYALGDDKGMVSYIEYSNDLGLTWHTGHREPSGILYCCDTGTIIGNKLLANGPSISFKEAVTHPTYFYTTPNINQVIGRTLYLR